MRHFRPMEALISWKKMHITHKVNITAVIAAPCTRHVYVHFLLIDGAKMSSYHVFNSLLVSTISTETLQY